MRNRILIAAALFALCWGIGRAQDDTAAPTDQAVKLAAPPQTELREASIANEEPIPVSDVPTEDPARAAERKKKALIGLAAIGGIAMLGVAVIAATIIWARRLRRLARDPGPAQKTAGNDFWFLKPPKPIVGKPDPVQQQSSRDSSAEMDASE